MGGFQKVYNKEVSRLGAIVQSGKVAAEAATALKEASIEAESAYSGVNLDTGGSKFDPTTTSIPGFGEDFVYSS